MQSRTDVDDEIMIAFNKKVDEWKVFLSFKVITVSGVAEVSRALSELRGRRPLMLCLIKVPPPCLDIFQIPSE